jgi:hypothetical protein
MTGVLRYQVACVSHHGLKNVEKTNYKLLMVNFRLRFTLEKLFSYVFESENIGVDGPNGFVHLNDLVQHIVFLPLFHQLEDFLAVLNVVLLPLGFELLHSVKIFNLQFQKFDFFQKVLHDLFFDSEHI